MSEDTMDTSVSMCIDDGTELIEVDIEDDVFLRIAKMAHEEDVTINEMFQLILIDQLERIDKGEIDAIH